ncbi:MAG: hypothetical protein AB8F74_11415 [Saprospiraceae bacterium]
MKSMSLLLVMISLSLVKLYGQMTTSDLMQTLESDELDYKTVLEIIKKNTALEHSIDDQILFINRCTRSAIKNTSYKEEYYEIKASNRGEKILRILSVNNDLIRMHITDRKRSKEYEFVNDKLYEKYKNDFEKSYCKVNNFSIFESDTLYRVGFLCGDGGTSNYKFDELFSLMLKRDKKTIIEWCQSSSPELRCYGAIGLRTLQKIKVELSKIEKELIDQISLDETIINICHGCTNWGFNSTIKEQYEFGNSYVDEFIKHIKRPRKYKKIKRRYLRRISK